MAKTHQLNEAATPGTEFSSLTELFHLAKSLIPKNQHLVTVSPDMTVSEAIELMQRYNYSQLPVVAGTMVLGVLSYRSLTKQLLKMGPIKEHFGDLPIDEFIEQFKFVQSSDNWESLLEYLNSSDGVLVGQRERLEGILTPMDVLGYLHNLASPFVALAEIELSLRRIIQACVDDKALQLCIQNSLAKKYGADEMPTQLSDMTLNDYVQIIGDGRNWSQFARVFGQGEWQRKSTRQRLEEVRDLRNDTFHFKRQITSDDYQKLVFHRDWLQRKARAFEALKPRPNDANKPKPKLPGGKQKWDETSFFRELEQQYRPNETEVAREILSWARSMDLRIWWGEGLTQGSFVPVLDHKGQKHQLFAIWTTGSVEIYFQWYQYKTPFNTEAKRRALLDRLNTLVGISIPPEAITKRPTIPLSILQSKTNLNQFLDIFNWVIQEIKSI